MEELRGHRRPTKSSFGHVHSAPFPAKSDAYGEIFDEMANSCSIPFLDLPPPDESFDGGSIGYSEIFCGVEGGDFAVDYEELSKKGVESLDSSSGRVYTDAKFGQKEERSGLSPEGAIFKDYGASPENKIQSISNHSDDGSNAVEQEKTNSSSYSTENTQNYRADMKTDEYSNKHAALEDASVNIKHGSHSSTNYSASSADDAPCVRTSDIELQTKPSRVAPPTKTPPKIIHKQENTKMEMPRRSIGDQEGNLLKPSRNHQIRYKLGAPKSHGLQTLDFLDVEVDAGSAAAASVAAMKEAMEQAQARLKHAKELMERQRDSNERRKKLGHRDDTRYDERKDAKAFEEYKNFREGTPNKTLPKEDKEMKDHAFDDLQKITEVGKAPSDHEASHTDAVTSAGSLQMRQGNGFKSSQMCSKLDELCGEWKAEEKFYELANNEKKISAVKEGEQEDAEKKLERTTKLNETCQHEHGYCHEENECNLETTSLVRERGASRNLYGTQGEFISVENDLKSRAVQNGNKGKEKYEELIPLSEANKKQNANRAPSVVADNVKTDLLRSNHTEDENGKFKVSTGAVVSEITHNLFDAAQDRAENKDIGGVKQVSRAEKEDIRVAYQEACLRSCSSSQDAVGTLGTVVTENSRPVGDRKDNLEREISIEREYEKEQARKAKEEKEMERERDEDRFAVERATREAHERAVSEARERAERIAVERATTEARQRSLTEARGKAQKASAEALEKSSLEKALKEAKLRAERAAVERATAEARERAVEKAIAEKAAAADARRRAERLTAISRDKSRKDNEAGSGMGDSGIKLRASSSDVLHDASFQCAGSSGSSQIYADSTAYGEEESALRCKARSERHQRTVERAAKALAEKNSLDVVAQREQEERNRFAELLDADVRRWSAGKEGNLRALLSTLQYILGPESGWQSIPLTDVITAAAVKKAYRKATLFVHPDKLQQRGASIQQKYICEKVFDLLKEAWNKFNSEEP